ncbi:MAG: tripartite tricarboxylate transporter TctB family protein [Pseudomonadota bacterium]
MKQSKNIMAEGDIPAGGKRAPAIFLLVITAYIAYALYDAYLIPSYQWQDSVFPMFVACVSLIAGIILLIQMRIYPETHTLFADGEHSEDAKLNAFGLWPTLAWFAFLLILTSLTGFIIALAAFLVLFMRLRAQMNWGWTLFLSAIGLGFMMGMAWLLNRDFPPGLLQSYFDLPWPFT